MKRIMRFIVETLAALFLLLVGLWFIVTQPLFSIPTKISPNTVSIEALQKHVRTLSETLPPRTFAENLDISADYISQQWQPFGGVQDMPFVVDGDTYHNLSIFFGPPSPKRLVIGAHYDAYQEHAGADDNASGVAALLELARLLQTAPLKQQVELVAFTLEEPPFFRTENMGSSIHAKKLAEQSQAIDLMISLEMIGYYSDAANSQDYPVPLMQYAYGNRGNFIAIAGNLGSIGVVRQTKATMRSVMETPVYSINAPTFLAGIDFSDHMNYWQHGFPALMITDTAFYRNQHYHSKQDTWDKLNYAHMAEVIQGIYAVIMDRAGKAP